MTTYITDPSGLIVGQEVAVSRKEYIGEHFFETTFIAGTVANITEATFAVETDDGHRTTFYLEEVSNGTSQVQLIRDVQPKSYTVYDFDVPTTFLVKSKEDTIDLCDELVDWVIWKHHTDDMDGNKRWMIRECIRAVQHAVTEARS